MGTPATPSSSITLEGKGINIVCQFTNLLSNVQAHGDVMNDVMNLQVDSCVHLRSQIDHRKSTV